ncbi:MAG: hypothetical protein U0903_01785 [Planctomycetales bacterium]
MPLYPEIFRSVEVIWLVWGLSLAVCIGIGCSLRRGRPLRWKELANDEDGASYSVPYVMTFPLYALFVGLVVECSLLLVTKVGTMYSAYAAARSAAVWESAKTGSGTVSAQKMNDMAQKAAVLAMVPFASGSSQHSAGSNAGSELVAPVLTGAELFRDGRFVNPNYLVRKVRYAASHTQVTISRESNGPQGDMKADVRFEAPFHIPGIGRILGKAGGSGYFVIDVRSEATIPSESPQNDTRDIGIQYLSE